MPRQALNSSKTALLLTLSLLAPLCPACAPELPEAWLLPVGDHTLVVEREPYTLRVLDPQGASVIESSGAGAGDGYGTLGWTRGATSWSSLVSPGWFGFEADFEEWRDDWVVVDGELSGAGAQARLTLELLPAELADDADEAKASARVIVTHIVEDGLLRVEASLTGDDAPRAWSAAFQSPKDEAFLGFGERFNRTNQRGVAVYSWAEEGGIGMGEGSIADETNPFPNGEAMTYYPVPYFLSTGGYGFWLDSTWRSQFELATERPDQWRVWHIGPRLAWELYLPSSADTRPWPYQIIDHFTARTGRPMVPPAWAFGPRRRIGRGDVQGGVSEIQAMRDLDLAITAADDALHFLPRGSHLGVEDQIRAWTSSARELGYRVCAYYNPYIEDRPENPLQAQLQEGKDKGYFLRDAEGDWSDSWLISGSLVTILTIDFTFAEAKAWYQQMLSWATDLGYSGWMYDFGEYVQPEVLTTSGESGEEHHNRFPVLYHQAAFEHLEASDVAGDWLTFVRSGFTGDQAWSPFVWSGDPAASFEDSDGLPSMVRAGLNLGVSGVPHFGGDINGFHCVADGYAAADEELLIRWIQMGAMSSNMQDQDACNGALDEGEKASIFSSELAQEAWRVWARLHTRLFPYLYSLAWEANESGAPVMRQFFLEHPEDPSLAEVDDAYYLGPALLVAPVLEVRGEVAPGPQHEAHGVREGLVGLDRAIGAAHAVPTVHPEDGQSASVQGLPEARGALLGDGARRLTPRHALILEGDALEGLMDVHVRGMLLERLREIPALPVTVYWRHTARDQAGSREEARTARVELLVQGGPVPEETIVECTSWKNQVLVEIPEAAQRHQRLERRMPLAAASSWMVP